jgi:hypothetical protein
MCRPTCCAPTGASCRRWCGCCCISSWRSNARPSVTQQARLAKRRGPLHDAGLAAVR